MLLLVSGATNTPRDENTGHLIVPRAWNRADSLNLQPGKWAMDNGAFSGFDEGAYIRMLEAFARVPGCLFVTAPDVVADAAATCDRWPFWSKLIRGLDLIPAFVAQDGLQPHMIPNLAGGRGALFIGGSTEYKTGDAVRTLCAYATSRGIWIHFGRVNGRVRYELAITAGANSFDGSGFSRWPDTRIPKVKQWQTTIDQQPSLGL